MITTILSKTELLDLLKGRTPGVKADRSKLVQVWRYIISSDKVPHWKRVLVNPDKVHNNPKFMRVIEGEESKLHNTHPQRNHLAKVDEPPPLPNLTKEEEEELQENLRTVQAEEVEYKQAKAKRQAKKVISAKTTLAVEKPKTAPTTDGLNKVKYAQAQLNARRYIQKAPWNTKHKFTKDEQLDNSLYKRLQEWDLYYYKPENIQLGHFHNQLMTALSVAMYHGFDPENPEQTIQNVPKELRISYYESVAADSSSSQSSSKLDVNKYSTERERNLASYINEMSTLSAIEACTRMGIVPQNTNAQEFIVNKLQTRLALAVLSDSPNLPNDLKDTIRTSWGQDLIEKLAKQATYDIDENSDEFDKLITNFVQILDNGELGYNPKLIIDAFKQLRGFSLEVMTNPQEHISVNSVNLNSSKNLYLSPGQIITSLNDAYSDHVTDTYKGDYLTNLGYTGNNPDVYKARSLTSLGNDGFIRFLKRVVSEDPQTAEEAKQIANEYKHLVNLVDGNPKLLETILTSDTWVTPNTNETMYNLNSILQLYNSLIAQYKQQQISYGKRSKADKSAVNKTVGARFNATELSDISNILINTIMSYTPTHLLNSNGNNSSRASSLYGEESITLDATNVLDLIEENKKLTKDEKDKLISAVLTANETFVDDTVSHSLNENLETLQSLLPKIKNSNATDTLTTINSYLKVLNGDNILDFNQFKLKLTDNKDYLDDITDIFENLTEDKKESINQLLSEKSSEDRAFDVEELLEETVSTIKLANKATPDNMNTLIESIKFINRSLNTIMLNLVKDNKNFEENQEFVEELEDIGKHLSSITSTSSTTQILKRLQQQLSDLVYIPFKGVSPSDTKTIMESINNTIELLDNVAKQSRNIPRIEDPDEMSILDFGIKSPQNPYQASQLVLKADALANAVISKLEQNGYSQEEIVEALRDTIHNDTLTKFNIANKTISFNAEDLDTGETNPFCIRNADVAYGVYSQVKDIRTRDNEIRQWRHLPAFYGNASAHWGQYMLHYTRSKYYKDHNIMPIDEQDELQINAAQDAYAQCIQMANVTADTYIEALQTSMGIFGRHIGGNIDGATVRKPWKYPSMEESTSISSQRSVILTNLVMSTLQHNINSQLADNAIKNSKSITNQYATDYSGTYDYYSGSVMKQIPTASMSYLPVGYFSNRNEGSFNITTLRATSRKRKAEQQIQQSAMTERVKQKGSLVSMSATELSSQIDRQLQQTPIWTEKYIDDIKRLKQDSATFSSSNVNDYINSPLKDVLLSVAHNSMYYMPKLKSSVHYSTYVASRLKNHPESNLDNEPTSPIQILQAREKCLENAKYSLRALSKEDTNTVWQELKSKYDYSKTDYRTPEGTVVGSTLYSLRSNAPFSIRPNGNKVYNSCALLNSPIFSIEDVDSSNFDTKNSIRCFTGSPYSGITKTPTDFSSRMGGAVRFCGSIPDGYRLSNTTNESADGLIMVASVLKGKGTTVTDFNPKANTDWSIHVNKPDMVLPQYLLDVSARIKGHNIIEDPQGYSDSSKQITYNTNGVSNRIKWDA